MKKPFMGILALVIGLSFSLATFATAQEPAGTTGMPPTVAPAAPAPAMPEKEAAKPGKKKGKKKGKRAGKKSGMKEETKP